MEKVHVDAGDLVKLSDLLITFDDSLESYELKGLTAAAYAAQVEVNKNQRQVNEADRFIRGNHLPQDELALRRAALATTALLDAAEVVQAIQQKRLDWHRITAPPGRIVARAPFSDSVSRTFCLRIVS